MLRTHLDHDEAREQDHAEHAHGDLRRTPSLRGALDERVHHSAEAERERRRAREVDGVVGLGIEGLGNVSHREHDHHGNDRQVDEEDGAPRHRLDQPTAEERPGSGGDTAQATPRSDRGAAIFHAERRRDDREAARHEERRGRALDATRRDEGDDAGCEAAEQGRDPERHETDQEHLAPAEAVAERSADHQQRAEREQVAVQHPLETREVGVEVAPDGRQRGGDDAPVEEGDPRPEHRGRDHPAAR